MGRFTAQLASYLYNSASNVAIAIAGPVVKYFIAYDDMEGFSRLVRARLVYSGASKAEYAANFSVLAGVEELYRSINFGVLIGCVPDKMKQSLNYGTFMAGAEKMEGGLNLSPVLATVTDFKRGYNVGGFSLCHGEVGEEACLGGVLAVAGTVRGRMCGFVTYCNDNRGEVVGFVNIVQRNGLSDKRDASGRIKKGRSYGLVNIDLSRPFLDGLSFGWS